MSNFKSVRRKITAGYIVLAIAAVVSVWYILNQVNKISAPNQEIVSETAKTFNLSAIITDVLTSESLSRTAILSAQRKDINRYHSLIDSIQHRIDTLKTTFTSPSTIQKLDSIQILLAKKERRFDEIILSRNQFIRSNDISQTLKDIEQAKQEINSNTTPADSVKNTDNFFSRLADGVADAVNSSRKKDREQKKIEKINQAHQAKSDSISKVTEQMLEQAFMQSRNAQQRYFAKEAQLIEESKVIAQQIRVLFEDIESSVMQSSDRRIENARNIISQTSTNLAWLGAIALSSIIILGIIVLRDLRNSYRNKQQVEKLNLELERLIKQKNYFLASITHDMVSPLNTTIGFSDLLDKTLQTNQQKEYLQNIQYSTKYIKNLVSDLVDFSKLEHDRIKLKKDFFNPKQLIDSTVNILQPEADKKDIELATEIGENMDTYIYSDEQRIRQILFNLLTNAIKFTHEGGVTLKADIEDHSLVFEVIDTGIGIDPKHHETIFLEFRQAHDEIEKTYGGTGLGLNITKRLINLFSGDIRFESEPKKGTVFTVTIPLDDASQVKEELSDKNYLIDEEALSEIRLLVVDDDIFQLQLMTEIFKNRVRLITTLSDGNQIENYLSNQKYDIILTDIQMPKLTGFEVIKLIKNTPEHKNIPVIALTGKVDLEEQEYLNLGFSAVVKKPIDMSLLMKQLYRLLNINSTAFNAINEPDESISVLNQPSEMYDFSDIIKLTGSDLSLIKPILQTFIASTKTALEDMKKAIDNQDNETISQLAHRILPMFRQLHIHEPIEALEELERNPDKLDSTRINSYFETANNCLKSIETDWSEKQYI